MCWEFGEMLKEVRNEGNGRRKKGRRERESDVKYDKRPSMRECALILFVGILANIEESNSSYQSCVTAQSLLENTDFHRTTWSVNAQDPSPFDYQVPLCKRISDINDIARMKPQGSK